MIRAVKSIRGGRIIRFREEGRRICCSCFFPLCVRACVCFYSFFPPPSFLLFLEKQGARQWPATTTTSFPIYALSGTDCALTRNRRNRNAERCGRFTTWWRFVVDRWETNDAFFPPPPSRGSYLSLFLSPRWSEK